ncbi:MAG TPA: class E sortase [Baekduia sp.]|nr:class E sortase [Baekduia sp.]
MSSAGAERRPRPRAERLAGWSLVAVGALLAADGAVTLAWQEPLGAVRQDAAQARLAAELAGAEREAAAALVGPAPAAPVLTAIPAIQPRPAPLTRTPSPPRLEPLPSRAVLRAQARRFAARLSPGAAVGRLQVPRLGLDDVVVQGTGAAQLREGPAHYEATALPGQGATVAIAGHRTTHGAPLRDADRLRGGDLVIVRMPYGTYRYRVTATRVVAPGAVEVLRSRPGRERLVLTTCHPRTSSSRRLVVFAAPERGSAPLRGPSPQRRLML